jgi:hypothetical protein
MKILTRAFLLLTIFFLISNSARTQLAFFLEVKTVYPTSGFSDGKIIPNLKGNYPNPITYFIYNDTDTLTTQDSLYNLSETFFYGAGSAITITAFDSIVNYYVAYAVVGAFAYPDISIEVKCDSIFGGFLTTSCEGRVYADHSASLNPGLFAMYFQETYLPNDPTAVVIPDWNSLTQTNLCDGMYTMVSQSYMLQTQFYVSSLIDNAGDFDVEIFTTPSSPSSCAGTATADVNGAAGPFTYSWDSIPVTQNNTSNLCPGLYSVYVTDASMDSVAALYAIVDSNNYYYDPSINFPADDTLFFMIENCVIDYSQPIDSIFITNSNFYTTVAVITFQLWQNGVATSITSSTPYEVPEESNFLIDLTLYCLSKDISGDLIKYQSWIGNAGIVGIESIAAERKIYPNPSDDIIYIETNDDEQIEIYSIQGSLVLTTSGNSIDLSDYPAGVYQVVIKNGTGLIVAREKLILQ